MTNKLAIVEAAKVDLAVLGNKKGYQWLEKQPEPKPPYTSKAFRDASESADNRKAELMKLKADIDAGNITIADVMNLVKANGGKLAFKQAQDMLGITPKTRASKTVAASVAPVITPADDVQTITKAERYFFDALLQMLRPEDIAEAKKQVLARITAERLAEVQRQAEEEMKGLNIDSLIESLSVANTLPEAPESDKKKK